MLFNLVLKFSKFVHIEIRYLLERRNNPEGKADLAWFKEPFYPTFHEFNTQENEEFGV